MFKKPEVQPAEEIEVSNCHHMVSQGHKRMIFPVEEGVRFIKVVIGMAEWLLHWTLA